MKGMPVLSAARQRGLSSGLGAVTKGTQLRKVRRQPMPCLLCQTGRENWAQSCQSPIFPLGAWPADHSTRSHQPFSKQQLQSHRLIRHP
eukprot:366366-Chlamydomonas_euryale.AAC.16